MNLYIDIETIPSQASGAFQEVLDAVKPPGQYKKPESIEKWMDENAEDVAKEEYHKLGLHGISGEIISIAWAIDDGEVKVATRPGNSEVELLNLFFECIIHEIRRIGEGEHARLTWIGHNVEFDLRYLKQRCLINNIKPPFIIPADAKHGFYSVFCTMKEWCGWKGYVSQDALCKAFSIEGKSDLDGSEVYQAWLDGEYDRIRNYNINDVRIVRELYRRMT